MNYCHQDSETYNRSDYDWEFQAKKAICSLYPDFDPTMIEEVKVETVREGRRVAHRSKELPHSLEGETPGASGADAG